HLYVGMRRLSGDGTRVHHAIWNTRMDSPLFVGAVPGDSYWADNPYTYPVAKTLAGIPTVAWIKEDLTIGLDGNTLDYPMTRGAAPASPAVTLLGGDQDEPVVLYGTLDDGGLVFLEAPGMDPIEVPQCQSDAGFFLSAESTFSTFPGYWLATWSKVAP